MKVRILIVQLVIAAVGTLGLTSTPLAARTACDSLVAFINAGQAQSGKKLTADQVRPMANASAEIKSDRDCE